MGATSPSLSGKPYLAFADVTLARGDRLVLDGLALGLSEPRIGLIGNNGSGKSTLLRLAAGLLLPDSGEVRVWDKETREHRRDLPREIGFLFQNPDHQILFPTVGEEVAFGLTEAGMRTKDADERARALLAQHGCAGWEDRATHALSDGQKQLVCLLAVLASEPSILLLDEPFSSLDLPTRLDISARLEALPQKIVMASHDLHLLAEFDRVIWLQDGRVRGDGPARDVLAAYEADVRAGRMKGDAS
ncbi:energy-coupling factor ABC transporter ATP-binding protein [Terrihabitans sp. B22-R8]|uniref:energy-coupling factor ABC transporter ATP-binding protein n=1 Tax=Terrihabitans sp. B22-R8 TaxID=3425128 RepID=UPI00403D11C3